jgi:Fic family protein
MVDNSAIALNIGNERDLNLEVRQSAILAKISELSTKDGGCALKELKEAFSDVSERTLRYDLQKLLSKGVIIKIGNRGPNTMYKVQNPKS